MCNGKMENNKFAKLSAKKIINSRTKNEFMLQNYFVLYYDLVLANG